MARVAERQRYPACDCDQVWREFGRHQRSIVLTDYIIVETGNGMARDSGRAAFIASVELIRRSPRARVICAGEDLLARALRLYASRQDKAWGLVDCSSFLIMQDESISDAFTSDHHFEQAGFKCLLPAS